MNNELVQKCLKDPKWRIESGVLYKIITKESDEDEGHVVNFIPNPNQMEFLNAIWYRNVILKARQLGFTTLVSILWLDHALFNKNQRCGIIAQDKDAAEAIFRDKVKFAYENLPEPFAQMFPLKRDSASELLFAHNNSSIRVATSMRSGTIHRLHVCLSGDTDILMKDGRTKKIRDIEPGDLVLTGNGSYLPVQRLAKNRIEDVGEPLLSLNIHGWHAPLKLTANHKILTREFKTGMPVWKEAGEVEPGDYIAFPIREISNKLRDGALPFGPQKVRVKNGRRAKNEGRRIKVTRNLGVLVGMYLAEGYIRRTETTFALHRGEVSEFAQLIEEFGDYFTSYRVYNCLRSLTTHVVVNGRDFADFLSTFFGCGEDKRIPDAVWNYGREFIDGLIFGYFQGDGCLLNPREVQVTSIRPQLIHQMRLLLISTRIGVPSIYHRPAGRYYGRNCKETWVLKLHGAANWKFRQRFGLPLPEVNTRIGQIALAEDGNRNPIGRKNWRRGKHYYWQRIKSVDITQDEEFVYDIVLPKDPHNYTTVNGVVHNSEMGKIGAKYPEKAKEIITGSIPSVPLRGVTIIESTAEGASGYYHDLVMRALDIRRAGGVKGNPRNWRLHFFAWWQNDEYRMPADKVAISQRDHEYFDEVEAYWGVKIDDDQRAWYVATRDADYKEAPELMWQEYPSTPEEAFQQSTEGAWFAKQMADLRKDGRLKKLPVEQSVPAMTFWDIGNTDGTAIWVVQRVGHEFRCIHFYEAWGEPYAHATQWLQGLGLPFDTHYLPHDAQHVRQGKTENKSPLQMLEELMPGARFEVVPRIENITWGIQQLRDMFSMIWIDEENCKEGVHHLDLYHKKWNTRLGAWTDVPEKADGHSEAADALRQMGQAYASGLLNVRTKRPSRRRGGNWRTV